MSINLKKCRVLLLVKPDMARKPATKKKGWKGSKRLDISIPLATVVIQTHVFTGVDPKTRPGVGITLNHDTEPVCIRRAHEDGTHYWELPLGVIDRDQIRALRNLLTDFILDFPEEESGA
jgi:hypothetical protein